MPRLITDTILPTFKRLPMVNGSSFPTPMWRSYKDETPDLALKSIQCPMAVPIPMLDVSMGKSMGPNAWSMVLLRYKIISI